MLELFLDDSMILYEFIEWLKENNRIIAKGTMLAGPVPEMRTNEEIICEYLGIEYIVRNRRRDVVPKRDR